MRLTHIMKMKDAESFTELFLKSLEPLRAARRLGPVLFQFAPTFKLDAERLAAYLPLLPRDIRFAFEFRHESWLTDAVYEQLGKHGVALCLAESEKLEIPKVFTADFGYFRLRKGDYPAEARHAIAEQVKELQCGQSRRLRLFQTRRRSERRLLGGGGAEGMSVRRHVSQ